MDIYWICEKTKRFFHLCTSMIKFLMISKTKMKSLKKYLFILFNHIFYLKFKSLLLFLYFINRCVCTRSSLKKNSNSKVVSYTYMYIHSLDAAEISNLKAISYIYILIDDRDSMALYDDRSMTSAEWTRRQNQRAHLKKSKEKVNLEEN